MTVDPDPIKQSLDAIEQDLENALANLNATNQRVDDLLTEYGSGDFTSRVRSAGEPAAELDAASDAEAANAESEDALATDDTADEPPPEY